MASIIVKKINNLYFNKCCYCEAQQCQNIIKIALDEILQ